MTLRYAGKYNGDESILPRRDMPKGTVAFKEPTEKKFAWIANGGSLITLFIFMTPVLKLYQNILDKNLIQVVIAFGLAVLSVLPHELLHAVCFKNDVYMYNNISKFMVFVVGTESMSKRRYIIMTLCPNVVLGLLPYALGIIFPNLVAFGIFGAICLAMGFGDYINAFNAIFQMPSKASTFLSGYHSYWYTE